MKLWYGVEVSVVKLRLGEATVPEIDLFFNLNSRSFTSKSLEAADCRLQQTLRLCCRRKQRNLDFYLILGQFFFFGTVWADGTSAYCL